MVYNNKMALFVPVDLKPQKVENKSSQSTSKVKSILWKQTLKYK